MIESVDHNLRLECMGTTSIDASDPDGIFPLRRCDDP